MAVTERVDAPLVASTSGTAQGSLLGRVAGLANDIRRAGDEAQQLRRCPSWVIDALVDTGLFRFAIPR